VSSAHRRHFLGQLLLGVLHMHSAGVLHRDLSSSNILTNAKCQLRYVTCAAPGAERARVARSLCSEPLPAAVRSAF
jgi:serine/threonine protein kinase